MVCVGLLSWRGFGQVYVSQPDPNTIVMEFQVSSAAQLSQVISTLLYALTGNSSFLSPNGQFTGYPPNGFYQPLSVLGVQSGGMYAQPNNLTGAGNFIQQQPYTQMAGAGDFGGYPLGRSYRVTSPFGKMRRSGPHKGVDLGSPTGTPCYALGSGVVTQAYYEYYGGRTLAIRYSNGYTSKYLHMRDFNSAHLGRVSKGTRVQRGHHVGHTNNSGASTTGAHLHFGMKDPWGRVVNPSRVPGVSI